MKPGQIGLVVRGHGRHYVVEDDHGERIHCLTRGKKSDCVVGDRVRWQRTSDHEGVIDKLEPRRNLLFRQDEWKTKSFAANLDRLLVLVAAEPQFSESQLTRALIAADSAGITTDILLNKTDLPQAEAAGSDWRRTRRWVSGCWSSASRATQMKRGTP